MNAAYYFISPRLTSRSNSLWSKEEIETLLNMENSGNLTMNDSILVELIMRYPFLYNVRVTGWGDEDYVKWAWDNITQLFLATYKKQEPPQLIVRQLLTECLQRRWNILKNVMLQMKDCYEKEGLPPALKQMMDCISIHSEESSNLEKVKQTSTLHDMFMANLPSIFRLPHEQKLRLKQDILELLLSLEKKKQLDENSPVPNKLDIERECKEILDAFDFDEMLLLAKKEQEKEQKK